MRKRTDGRLSLEQQAWLCAFADCNVESYVWRSGDIQEITEVLAR